VDVNDHLKSKTDIEAQTKPRAEDLEMIDVSAIQEFFRYNRWANERVFEAVSRLSENEFVDDLGSGHSSVRDTLTHIVWAEWLWLQRWMGRSSQSTFQATNFPRPNTLKDKWTEVETDQRAFIEGVPAEGLLAVVRYVNLEGETWQYPLWRQMYHVVNHSSYHRGQVSTMLSQFGGTARCHRFSNFSRRVLA
jgi:uncharacterized damage-inducible protein DinB